MSVHFEGCNLSRIDFESIAFDTKVSSIVFPGDMFLNPNLLQLDKTQKMHNIPTFWKIIGGLIVIQFSFFFRKNPNLKRNLKGNWNIAMVWWIRTNTARLGYSARATCLRSNKSFTRGCKKWRMWIQRRYQNLRPGKCSRTTWKIITQLHCRIKSKANIVFSASGKKIESNLLLI